MVWALALVGMLEGEWALWATQCMFRSWLGKPL
jgi:hypothetical protein